jgi:hypothetical protein
MNFSYDGSPLPKVSFVKYLGILIDPRLDFQLHISSVMIKCSSAIGIMKRLNGCLNLNVRRLICFGLIHSHLSYGSVIRGHSFDICVKSTALDSKLQDCSSRDL